MTTPNTDNPRVVTPGIETQSEENKLPPPGIYVGLDWIRCNGPEALHYNLIQWFTELCNTDGKEAGRAKWFKRGLVWNPGIMLSWGHSNKICQVDIQGQRLRLLSGQGRIDMLDHFIGLGMKPTRLDGALDLFGHDHSICVNAEESCQRGELCLLRRYSPNNEFDANGTPIRRLLKLGARSSAVCGRIYDKGLEQNAAPLGEWERLEIEWKKDRVLQVAHRLLNAGSNWPDELTGMILGALDFRKRNGRSEMDRRPRAAWWAYLLRLQPASRLSPAAQEQSFEKWLMWFQSSVGPRLIQLAAQIAEDPHTVVTALLDGCAANLEPDLVTAGFTEWLQIQKSIRDKQN